MTFRHSVLPAIAVSLATTAGADGFAVDKVYHPYVEAMEQELEWRVVGQSEPTPGSPRKQLHRLGYGRALGDRWFGEVYLLAERPPGGGMRVEGYEVEARYQFTEQGEYWADWGFLFELEKEHGEDIWEAGGGVLVEKEHGQWSTAANLLLTAEWGDGIEDELESSLALQSRYRMSPAFEPGLEFHSAQGTRALGPVMVGDIRLGQRRTLRWELGAFVGLDGETPDYSFRAGLEYGF
jgi:hypothetical protein